MNLDDFRFPLEANVQSLAHFIDSQGNLCFYLWQSILLCGTGRAEGEKSLFARGIQSAQEKEPEC